MRAAIICLVLATLLTAAIALDASTLVTTILTIPLGAIVGFNAVIAVASRIPQRRRRRSRRAPSQAVSNVVVLHPQRARPLALPAPIPYRLAA